MKCDKRKRRCHNCKHSSKSFKIGKLTHHHCINDVLYPKEKLESGELSPWDTLVVFNDTCSSHEFKIKAQ